MVVEIGSADGYIRGREGLARLKAVGDHQFSYQAGRLRQERSGMHAVLRVLVDGKRIGYSELNVERDSERVTFCNSTYQQLLACFPDQAKSIDGERGKQLPWYPKSYFKDDLDGFCHGLEEASNDRFEPKPMSGSLERHEPCFVLRPYILRDGGTILFAPPGQGKSYALWTMAVCIDAGIDTLWPVQQGRVLVINLERSERSVADRLGNINHVLGLDRGRPIDAINARGRTLGDVAPAIRRYVDKRHPDVVLLDSMSRAGRGSLVADDVVNGYCDILNGFGPAWLALAHSPRADATHVFGSVMFEAAADLTVRLTSHQKLVGPMGIALSLEKKNDVGKQPLWVGAFDFDAAGLVDVRRAREGEFYELEAEVVGEEPSSIPATPSLPDAVVRHCALKQDWQTAQEISDATGYSRQKVSEFLNASVLYQAKVDPNDARKKFYRLKSVTLKGLGDRSGDGFSRVTDQVTEQADALPF